MNAESTPPSSFSAAPLARSGGRSPSARPRLRVATRTLPVPQSLRSTAVEDLGERGEGRRREPTAPARTPTAHTPSQLRRRPNRTYTTRLGMRPQGPAALGCRKCKVFDHRASLTRMGATVRETRRYMCERKEPAGCSEPTHTHTHMARCAPLHAHTHMARCAPLHAHTHMARCTRGAAAAGLAPGAARAPAPHRPRRGDSQRPEKAAEKATSTVRKLLLQELTISQLLLSLGVHMQRSL